MDQKYQRTLNRDDGSYNYFPTPMTTLSILDIISCEEAILTIGESLYGKYKCLDMV